MICNSCVQSSTATVLLEQVKLGNRNSVQPLLELYMQRMVALAASRMPQAHLADYAEDVALSAFKSLCIGAENGKFPNLFGRDDLWRMLAIITVRKAIGIHRRKKLPVAQPDESELAQIIDRRMSPAGEAEMNEEVEALLDQLGDDEMRQIAVLKGEGYTNEEIATRLGKAVRTIERKLHRIRRIWIGRV